MDGLVTKLGTMPNWLVTHLQNIGAMGNDRIGRRVHTRRCRHCRYTILVGLDNDMCALPAYVDPLPLAPIGEAVALLDGRSTYALRIGIGRAELQIRDRWQIAATPAGSRLDVLAAHRCGAGPLPSAPTVNRPTPPGTSCVPF